MYDVCMYVRMYVVCMYACIAPFSFMPGSREQHQTSKVKSESVPSVYKYASLEICVFICAFSDTLNIGVVMSQGKIMKVMFIYLLLTSLGGTQNSCKVVVFLFSDILFYLFIYFRLFISLPPIRHVNEG